MFRRPGQTISRTGTRALHEVPEIGLKKNSGLPGLFSPRGLDIAWFDYQNYLITELNRAVEKQPELSRFEKIAPLSEACAHSPDPELRRVGALAAQAYTNEFFFRSLRSSGSVNNEAVKAVEQGSVYNSDRSSVVDVSNKVANMPPHPSVEESTTANSRAYSSSTQQPLYPSFSFLTDPRVFGGVAPFRELLISRGDAQFGNGAVWLVKNNDKAAMLNTYGWGTPFSHSQTWEFESLASTSVQLSVVPVLSINLWEHVYLHDYGVAGKRQFLENAFDCIDWAIVDDRLAPSI